jgi:oligogalacturonide transport system permease protein
MGRSGKKAIVYFFLILLGIVMIYPLLWVLTASFKDNIEIFSSATLIPHSFSFQAFSEGWHAIGQYTFGTFLLNTCKMVLPTVLFTVLSSTLVAYGFARFNFPLKKPLFVIMLSTLMLPTSVLIIPRYLIFRNLGWLNTYLPFIVPAVLACYPFFIYMMVQFMRSLPKELEESAYLDGCNSFTTLLLILLPLCKPAIISMLIFQFIWTWNDFFNSLIYINSVSKYTLPLALNMTIDATTNIQWNQIMAMALVAMLPCVILFFTCQKYFVEGIATSGMKG